MTEEQTVDVLTALMHLQATVFALDKCQQNKEFNTLRTKQHINTTINVITKDHANVFKSLWMVDGVEMPQVIQSLEAYAEEVGKVKYYNIPEITALVRAYNAGEFEEIFRPTRDEQ
mgnify:CR=1 FL=1